jgi:hypothetical protein
MLSASRTVPSQVEMRTAHLIHLLPLRFTRFPPPRVLRPIEVALPFFYSFSFLSFLSGPMTTVARVSGGVERHNLNGTQLRRHDLYMVSQSLVFLGSTHALCVTTA